MGWGRAKRCMEENNTLIICGKREEALKDAAKQFPSLVTRVCDLSVEADRVELFKWIEKNHSDVNVLVNNAGIQNWMDVSDENFYKRANDEITINALAPVHLTNLFLNLASIKTVMNVTSGLAFVPLAKVPVYCATKAFMRSFTLSLRRMLKEKNIEVIEVIPPALNTDLGAKGIHSAYPPVSDFIESIFEQLKSGRTELTFAMSEDRLKANNETIQDYFNRMNP